MYLIEVNNDNTFCKCTTFGWNRLDLFCVSIHYIDEIKTILYKIKKHQNPYSIYSNLSNVICDT